MAVTELRPLAFGPNETWTSSDNLSLTGTEFVGCFLVDFDIASQFPLEAVMSEAPGEFPDYIRGDPQDRVVPLHIIVQRDSGSVTLAMIDELKAMFTPSRDELYLFVEDTDNVVRRMLVKSLGLVPWEGHPEKSYVASLQAAEPVWEGYDLVTDNESVSASPQNWTVTNDGNERTFPLFTLTPVSNKGNGNDFIRRWAITIAWRSPLDGVDSLGLGYPIDITDRSWDTAAEIAASRMQADGDDIRVFVDGVEFDRYLDDVNQTGTAVWTAIPFQPARQAIVASVMTGVAPGAGDALEVSNPEGTSAFPEDGTLLIENEAITYNGKTDTAFLDIRRGQRDTVAAGHAAGIDIWWVEHDIQILTNYTAYANPLARSDREPIINKALSSNIAHEYSTTDGMIAPSTLRPGQLLRQSRGPSPNAASMSLEQDSGIAVLTDEPPQAGAPNFDALSLYAPCFIDTIITGVVFDYEVDHDMLFELFGVDEGGFESRLLRRDIRGELWDEPGGGFGPDYIVGDPAWNVGREILPIDFLARLTLHGRSYRVTGTQALIPPGQENSLTDVSEDAQGYTWDADVNHLRAVKLWMRNVPPNTDSAIIQVRPLDPVAGPAAAADGVTGILDILAADLLTGTEIISIFWGADPEGVGSITIPAGGTYGIVFEMDSSFAGQEIRVMSQGAGGSIYGRGDKWDGGSQIENDDFLFAVCGDEPAQPEVVLGLGNTVRFRNLRAHLDQTRTPAIVIGTTPSNLYLIDATLENVTTGQTLAIFAIIPIAPLSRLQIDCDNHIVQKARTGELTSIYAGAVEPDDLEEWLRLDPGVNSLRWTEPNIGTGGISVLSTYRPRWT